MSCKLIDWENGSAADWLVIRLSDNRWIERQIDDHDLISNRRGEGLIGDRRLESIAEMSLMCGPEDL